MLYVKAMKKIFLSSLILLMLAFSLAFSQSQQQRFALLIGNNAYANNSSLNHSIESAIVVARALATLDFEVEIFSNLNRHEMSERIRSFADKLPEDALVFFYYSGHGFSAEGKPYLVPIDANISFNHLSEAKHNSLALNDVLDVLEESATTRIVVIDSCRNTLRFNNSRSLGLAASDVGAASLYEPQPHGTLLAFSAANNACSRDTIDYAETLATYLTRSNLDIHEVFRSVRNDIFQATNGQVMPESTSAIIGDIILRRETIMVK